MGDFFCFNIRFYIFLIGKNATERTHLGFSASLNWRYLFTIIFKTGQQEHESKKEIMRLTKVVYFQMQNF